MYQNEFLFYISEVPFSTVCLTFRKTEPAENEIINAQSVQHPIKLPFNVSEETAKDIAIAADNIDR